VSGRIDAGRIGTFPVSERVDGQRGKKGVFSLSGGCNNETGAR
jgi:hypothetical protein